MNYKITLTPLDKFFFGGENVFGAENGQDERRRSYLVKSNILPQQTTLLGMLRQQLLTQNGLLLSSGHTAEHLLKAIVLVGSSGFSTKQGGDAYGVIKSLSPVVITDESGQVWQPAPLDDRQMQDKDKRLKPLIFSIDSDSQKPLLTNLNPKEEMGLHFDTANGQPKPLSDFFHAYDQVGITMTNRVKHRELSVEDRKESYYRQTFLGNGASAFAGTESAGVYSFTFWVNMSETISNYKFQDTLVYMGGERSAFQMRIEPITDDQDLKQYLSPVEYRFNHLSHDLEGRIKRIVLLSDAYADWSLIQQNSVFAVTQVVPFRYFTTVLGRTSRFYDFKQQASDAKQQSKLHTLLQRGSVIYVEGDTSLKRITDHLDNQQAFQHIGYNYYKTI